MGLMNENIDLERHGWYDKAMIDLSLSSHELAEQIQRINRHIFFARICKGWERNKNGSKMMCHNARASMFLSRSL